MTRSIGVRGVVSVLGLVGLTLLVTGCSSADSDSSSVPASGLKSNSPEGHEAEGSGGSGTATSGGSSGSAGTLALDPSPGDGESDGPSGTGGTTSSGGTGASSPGSGGSSASASPPESSGSAGTSAGTPAGTGGSTGGTGSSTGGSETIKSGTLTAGAWDDNLNFDFFSAYRQRMDVVYGAELLPITADEYRAANENYAQTSGAKQTLDVSLVIDTTGSMGDEMAYLQTEFSALSQAIADAHPNAEQRWSLIVYRDVGDDYVVRSFDFSTDTGAFQKHLAAQSANGGGDFPEAPDQALAAVPKLDWRGDDKTARLAFWVADAPNHPENNDAMLAAIRGVGTVGVHIYPVASSGIDEVTELTMRSAAELTGGRYLFLTDDSGVGGPHKEPTIPCYFVTKLDDAIERMVDIELTGVYREPDASEVIRTGGDPQSRACKLDSGESVLAY